MGLETQTADEASTATVTGTHDGGTVSPASTQRERKPRDPEQAKAAAEKAAARRLLKKLGDVKNKEDLFAKLDEMRGVESKPAAKAAAGEVAKVDQVDDAERLQRLHAATLQQVLPVVQAVAQTVEGTPYELEDLKAVQLAHMLTPYAAESGEKVSPKSLALLGLALWLVPPTVKIGVTAGKAWWAKRKAAGPAVAP